MLDDDRLICTQPFNWCEIHTDGSVFACCPSWLSEPLGNLLQTPFQDIWNGFGCPALASICSGWNLWAVQPWMLSPLSGAGRTSYAAEAGRAGCPARLDAAWHYAKCLLGPVG